MGIIVNASPQLVGVWTPVLLFGATVVTGTSVGGNWIKIGRLVWVEGDVLLSGKNGTGLAVVTGLPFTTLNDAGSGSFFSLALSNMVQPAVQPVFYQGGVASNAATFGCARLTGNGTAMTEVFLTDADFNTTSYIKFSGTYISNS